MLRNFFFQHELMVNGKNAHITNIVLFNDIKLH